MRDIKNASASVGICGCVSVCFRVRDKNAKNHYIICTYEWTFRKKGEPKNSGDTLVEQFNNDNEENSHFPVHFISTKTVSAT